MRGLRRRRVFKSCSFNGVVPNPHVASRIRGRPPATARVGGILDCRGSWKQFDGNTTHSTEPFFGEERFSIILRKPASVGCKRGTMQREAPSDIHAGGGARDALASWPS